MLAVFGWIELFPPLKHSFKICSCQQFVWRWERVKVIGLTEETRNDSELTSVFNTNQAINLCICSIIPSVCLVIHIPSLHIPQIPHTHMHTSTYMHTHRRTHTHAHKYIHAHTCAHMHTHRRTPECAWSLGTGLLHSRGARRIQDKSHSQGNYMHCKYMYIITYAC